MPEDPNSIVIKDVKFSYDIAEEDSEKAPRLALDGISVTIEKGSYTAILGSNGSGKSTLAKIIDILEVPDSGVEDLVFMPYLLRIESASCPHALHKRNSGE